MIFVFRIDEVTSGDFIRMGPLPVGGAVLFLRMRDLKLRADDVINKSVVGL